MERDFKRELLDLVDRLLDGEMELEEFVASYSARFIDEMPDSALDPSELQAFGAIHEKAEWTSPHPSKAERDYGWLDTRQYLSWLREQRKTLPG